MAAAARWRHAPRRHEGRVGVAFHDRRAIDVHGSFDVARPLGCGLQRPLCNRAVTFSSLEYPVVAEMLGQDLWPYRLIVSESCEN